MTKKKTTIKKRTEAETSARAMTVMESLGWPTREEGEFYLKTDKLELSCMVEDEGELRWERPLYLLFRDRELIRGKHQVIIHVDRELDIHSRYTTPKPMVQAELDMLYSMATNGVRTNAQRKLEAVLRAYKESDMKEFESKEAAERLDVEKHYRNHPFSGDYSRE